VVARSSRRAIRPRRLGTKKKMTRGQAASVSSNVKADPGLENSEGAQELHPDSLLRDGNLQSILDRIMEIYQGVDVEALVEENRRMEEELRRVKEQSAASAQIAGSDSKSNRQEDCSETGRADKRFNLHIQSALEADSRDHVEETLTPRTADVPRKWADIVAASSSLPSTTDLWFPPEDMPSSIKPHAFSGTRAGSIGAEQSRKMGTLVEHLEKAFAELHHCIDDMEHKLGPPPEPRPLPPPLLGIKDYDAGFDDDNVAASQEQDLMMETMWKTLGDVTMCDDGE